MICTKRLQLYLIGYTNQGCEFSTPLVAFSYETLVGIADDKEGYFLTDSPDLRAGMKAWEIYCKASGINAEGATDVTLQVWHLYQAMNGNLPSKR